MEIFVDFGRKRYREIRPVGDGAMYWYLQEIISN